ncbi:hypothetical protein NEFER03_2000 [Nematocida sp. LUAm3]|nr:hypothetical protein NEFER03_2000 [Nematocida sp. LUAm3]KAI5176084.1 hypothetical protein NEFER02_1918 [Nematocida sp. LUAm2]KAI5177128.1 hypothetical protein NEFER01_0403 [Nematocida sp. LUAm1]
MTILYIPVYRKHGFLIFEESFPSALENKVSEEEWMRVIEKINFLLRKRAPSFLCKVFSVIYIGVLYQRIVNWRVDQEISDYLKIKNITLERSGVYMHHPKDRMYSGMDISVYATPTEYLGSNLFSKQ